MARFYNIPVLICALMGFCPQVAPAATSLLEVVDLSGWSFAKSGPITLSEGWRFHTEQFVAPSSWREVRGEQIRVPASWAKVFDTANNGVPNSIPKYGTYTLRLSGGLDGGLSVRFPTLHSAAQIFAVDGDGNILSEIALGRVSSKEDGELPIEWVSRVLELPAMSERVDDWALVVWVSSHQHPKGGLTKAPIVDLQENHRSTTQLDRLAAHLLLGVLLVVAFYHLVLFAVRRKDRVALFYGLSLSMVGLRTFVTGVAQEFEFWNTLATHAVLKKVEYGSLALVAVCFWFFLVTLLKAEGRAVNLSQRFIVSVGILLAIVSPMLSPMSLGKWLPIFQLYILSSLLVGLALLVYLSINGKRLAWLSLGAFGLLLIGALNDILLAQGVLSTSHLYPYTAMGFVVSQSLIIATNVARVFEQRDASNRALLETYSRLDDELLNRESLQRSNQRLKEENELASTQLIQAEKLSTLGTLVAGVAHDIANPTGLAFNASDTMITVRKEVEEKFHQLIGDDDSEEVAEVRAFFTDLFDRLKVCEGDITLALERITAINNAIRNQSRIESTQGLTSLRLVISECLTIVKARLTGIEVDVRCDDNLMVVINRSEFGQVLMNLISNAADAIHERDGKGVIRLSADGGPEGFSLVVEDSGPGIPLELREKILQPFFTTKVVGEGTGLGMSIVIKILEAHRMILSVGDSEELGGAKLNLGPMSQPESSFSSDRPREPTVGADGQKL